MRYTPRTIAFLCDLHHSPAAPDPRPVQKLHNEMFQGGEPFGAGDPLYRSFHVTHEGAVLSNPVTRLDAGSSVSFTGNKIAFREELSGLSVDDFADGEVARVHLPRRVPEGFHGNWVPDTSVAPD